MSVLSGFGAALLRYVKRCGVSLDMSINVLWGGQLDQTFSYRCAVAQRDGKWWGCRACWLLGILVQPRHCPDQFTDAPTPGFDYVRAALSFAAVFVIAGAVAYSAWRVVGSML